MMNNHQLAILENIRRNLRHLQVLSEDAGDSGSEEFAAHILAMCDELENAE